MAAPDRSVSPAGLDLQERVVEINRVAKVVKGGRRFSFTALVVVGDENGIVGAGYGKANEVPLAIQKGVERAKKNLFRVPRHGSTITHQTTGIYNSGRVFLKPAAPGNGVTAGGGVRAVLELAGIRDVLSKSLGSQNPINAVKATIAALQDLRRPEEIAALRGLSVNAVLGLAPKAETAATETISADGNGSEATTAEAAVAPDAPGTEEAQETAGEPVAEAAEAAEASTPEADASDAEKTEAGGYTVPPADADVAPVSETPAADAPAADAPAAEGAPAEVQAPDAEDQPEEKS